MPFEERSTTAPGSCNERRTLKDVQTDILYLDFAKAFDSVDHGILLAKLRSYEVSGNLLNWITDYLHGRVHRVVVDGVASDWASVTFGVPQGRLLGPILFAICINGFPKVVSDTSQTALYADDSKTLQEHMQSQKL